MFDQRIALRPGDLSSVLPTAQASVALTPATAVSMSPNALGLGAGTLAQPLKSLRGSRYSIPRENLGPSGRNDFIEASFGRRHGHSRSLGVLGSGNEPLG